MFLEIILDAYDVHGRKSYKPHLKKQFFPPTFPFGRYVSQPLRVQCASLLELQKFLVSCKAMSDKEAFGKDDYWLPPDKFEMEKKGDCDDFALWTWRQLMQMGFPARFVAGRYGRYREGHAWVQFEKDGKPMMADPLFRLFKNTPPHISTLWYEPIYSVEWQHNQITFYSHTKPAFSLPLSSLIPMSWEWIYFWSRVWLRVAMHSPRIIYLNLRKRMRGATPEVTQTRN
jgi:hypothetical protein